MGGVIPTEELEDCEVRIEQRPEVPSGVHALRAVALLVASPEQVQADDGDDEDDEGQHADQGDDGVQRREGLRQRPAHRLGPEDELAQSDRPRGPQDASQADELEDAGRPVLAYSCSRDSPEGLQL